MHGLRSLLRLWALVAVCSVGAWGCGGDDEEHSGPLTAPTEVKAMVVAGPAVHLTWKDTASEHHYSIERKDGAGGTFKEISTEVFDKTAHHDATINAGTTYTYRLAAMGGNGEKSPYSAEVSVTVP